MIEKKEHGQVVLTRKEYDELLEDSKFLNALMSAGVDNWEGYEDALDMMDSE
jgi:hypothetical protein